MTPIFYNKLFKKLNSTISINYKNIIKGKRIIIVGPSKYLIDRGEGSNIDSYESNDIVIKINNGYKLRPIDYGRRCEILYINNKLQKQNPYIKHYVKDIKRKIPSLKCIVFTRINGWKIIDRIDDILIFYVSRNEHVKISYPLSISYLLGTCAIINILLCKPKQLTLIGFDFYERIKINNGDQLYYRDLYPIEYHGAFQMNTKLNPTHKDLNKSDLFFIKYMIENRGSIDIIKDIPIVLGNNTGRILNKYSI